MTTYDYVVIGAGSAGCVLANRLTADPNVTVLLLEAGDRDTKPEIQIPPAWVTLLGSEIDWQYMTEVEPGLANRQLRQARGKVLGGTSAINAMIYIRANAKNYDGWQAAGNAGWGYEDVLPYFRKSEHYPGPASKFHGTEGSLAVSALSAPHPLSNCFIEAAVSLGYPRNPDFNGESQLGAGFYPLNTKEGKRHSCATAFLEPIRDRPNLTIATGAQATRLLFSGDRVSGVAYQQNGVMQEVTTDREVILTAGVFDSPKLLLLSGIGPADQLRALEIPVKVDLPGVGQNLHDHLLVSVGYQATQDVPPPAPDSNLGEAGLFLHSQNRTDAAPDLQLVFLPVIFVNPAFARENAQGFTVLTGLVDPKSRGHLQLRSADPLAPPRILVNYLQQQADVDALVTGVKRTRELLQAGAFDPFRGEEIAPGAAVVSDDAIAAYVRQTSEAFWHSVGTCKMGHDPLAVVDDQLRVRGVTGLRVADASIMPTIPTGNTHAPTMMIAEKAADLIKNSTH
ncbi:GMC family oxidoreductase [Trichothermofontia sp.]